MPLEPCTEKSNVAKGWAGSSDTNRVVQPIWKKNTMKKVQNMVEMFEKLN